MRTLFLLPLLSACLLLTGCFHTKVNTGKQASSQVVENKWSSSFINGLVPPSTVEVTQQCTHGVARIETQHSFLNLLATGITFGLYSPMHIKVTCAADGSMSTLMPAPEREDLFISANAPKVEIEKILSEAATQSVTTGKPVSVRLTK